MQTGSHFFHKSSSQTNDIGIQLNQQKQIRQMRPSRFLNDVDLQIPLLALQYQDEQQKSSIRFIKSLETSPAERTIETEHDVDDFKIHHQHIFRKQKKQKLIFGKDHHQQSQQELPKIVEGGDGNIGILSPKTKTQTTDSTPKDKFARSPVLKAAQMLINNDNIKSQKQFEESQRKIEHLLHFQSGPQISINQQSETKRIPHHKKTVSFRKSILIFNIDNGQVSKEEISEYSRPLHHTIQLSSREKINQNQHLYHQNDSKMHRKIQQLNTYEELN